MRVVRHGQVPGEGVGFDMTKKGIQSLLGGAAVAVIAVLGYLWYDRGADLGLPGGKEPTVADKGEGASEPAPDATVADENASQAEGEAPEADTAANATAPSGAADELQASRQQQADAGQSSEAADSDAEPRRVGPTFDVFRVEPSGDAVVAGRSEAGSIIALLSNGEIVGKGIANEVGEFAIVLEKPLEPGTHDVKIEAKKSEADAPVVSEESIAVSVPEDKNGEVLVVLNKPDKPTEVLQKPDEPAPATQPQTEVAQVGPESDGDEKQVAVADDKPQTQADDSGETDVAAGQQTDVTSTDAGQDEAQEQQIALATPQDEADAREAAEDVASSASPAPQTDAPSSPAGTAEDARGAEVQTGVGGEPSASAAATDDDAAPATAASNSTEETAQGAPAAASASTQQTADAAAQDDTSGQEPGQTGVNVTVDAVETEQDKLFVAGESDPGSDVRVYVDNELVGQTKANEQGRWLLEGDKKIEPGEVDVRADKVENDEGRVTARAEVTFERVPDQIALRPISVSAQGSGSEGVSAQGSAGPIPNVIIRRGDNLWTISRRLYGQGIRYTTIYQANQQQIRDPDLIYPGQVFVLPVRDKAWDGQQAAN